MRKKAPFLLFGLAAALMLSTAASAFTLLNPPRRWFSTPRVVHVDNRGLSSVNDATRGVTAAVNAVNAWNTPTPVVTEGQSGTVAYVLGDGISDLIFGDPRRICKGSCIAATTTGFYNTGTTGTCDGLNVVAITDSDVAYNLRFKYTTAAETAAEGGCSSEIYLEAVTTHEIGHVIGLGHSGVSSALMAPTVSYCFNKPLATDDFNGKNALYDCTSFP